MPQIDLEAFVSSVCAGISDQKITCESTLPDDFPPESYFLTKDAQLDWVTDNAFFDRKDSHRRNSSNLNSNPNSNQNSQRFLLNSKASIIGFPKPQKTCFDEVKKRINGRRIDKNRVFLKRVGSRIKRDTSLLEPSSPKVSCIGRVRSKRERSQRIHRQKSGRVDPVKKPGFWGTFRAIFRIKRGCKNVTARDTQTQPSRINDIRSRLPPENIKQLSVDGDEPVVPSLGGMGRFVSGRRLDLLGE